jgi:hypothetical protein
MRVQSHAMSAKSELAAHLMRHHPEVAARIVGMETVDHPSDGALAAVARLRFNTKDNSQSPIAPAGAISRPAPSKRS